MRAHEFLCEQSHEDLARDALITLITTQHAMGIPTIKTSQLLKSLEERNFFMDKNWLWGQVQDMSVVDVENSTPEEIVLDLPDSEPAVTPKAPVKPDRAKAVQKMAKNALTQRIK